ncbi:MAG: hypothetical protein NT118_15650 [Lentisphaerae bacterium]|nr:hypothetical protein [Lentisphaerota bacterium]
MGKKSVEAIQFKGNFDAIEAFVGGDAEWRGSELIVATRNGPLKASHHDWIIKGVNDEFFTCRPETFEKLYKVEVQQK